MPGGNGMGPMGMGPMTGWGRGGCSPAASAGQPFAGRGFGRGGRNRFQSAGMTGWRRGFVVQPGIGRQEESGILKEQAEYLSAELEAVRSRLTEIEKNEAK